MRRPVRGRVAWRRVLALRKEGVEKVVFIMSMLKGRLWAEMAEVRAVLAVAEGIAAFILSGFTGWCSTWPEAVSLGAGLEAYKVKMSGKLEGWWRRVWRFM